MTNELQVFNNAEFGQVRTLVEDNKILFCANDVAKALGYKIPKDAVKQHCRGAVKHLLTDSLGREQETNFIPEGDVYRLIIRSKLPAAEKFESWVFDEVLPTLHKTGSYNMAKLPNFDDPVAAARAWADAVEARRQAQKQIEADKPKVLFADAVATAKTSILIGELAKLIKQNGYDIGQKRLFNFLREKGYLIKRKGVDYNMPTQKSMNLGLFEIKERTINHTDHVEIVKTTKVTGKGQIYFINLFGVMQKETA